jgi:hypothetical protein
MKMLAEYVEHARQFDQMAAAETNPKLKAVLHAQAEAYRKLAIARAKKLGLHAPPKPENSN